VLQYSAQYAVSLFCATFIPNFIPVINVDAMKSITNVSTKYVAHCFRVENGSSFEPLGLYTGLHELAPKSVSNATYA